MNSKTKSLFQNLRYAVSANLFIMLISIVTSLVLPIFLSIKDYGYWQLYLFYYGYVGFFHFGWLDGIYLKEGGNDYSDLDHHKLGSEFWYHFIYEILIGVTIIFASLIIIDQQDKLSVILLTIMAMIITNCRTFLLLLFQATNRIKDYANLARNDRYIFLLVVLAYIFLGGRNYIYIIIFDILSKLIMLIYGCYLARDLIFIRILAFHKVKTDIKDNISSGSSLMLSTIASGLITGFSRLFVEDNWNISTFAKLSFTLSISNMIMTFINAVSVVIFPLLRKTSMSTLKEMYSRIRSIFVVFSFAILLSYFPLAKIMESILPAYKDSLEYMGILFPMVVYEGRMSLLISTYLKTIRKERFILVSNIMTLIVSVSLSFFCVFFLGNLKMTVASILLSIFLRCLIAEKLLTGELGIDISKKIILETLLTILFVVCNLLFTHWLAFILYFALYTLYVLYNKVDLKKNFEYIRTNMKN